MLISEGNSVACRGKWGVSNSPASAVWGLRLVINVVRAGILSVRFHSSGSSYDPFAVDGSTVSTRPLYAALETAVQLLPVGATVSTLRTPSSLMGILVTDPDGATTYVVTNYSSQPVDVELATSHSASVLRVQAHLPVLQPLQQANAVAGTLTVAIAPNTVVAITPA
jgi:hypothetical protein